MQNLLSRRTVCGRSRKTVCPVPRRTAARLIVSLLALAGTTGPVAANVIDTQDHPALPASCLLPDAGAPSCGLEASPGSARFDPDVPLQVGNPIHVISGNKYQYELDYQSPASGLTLARHYNSSLSPYDVGLGGGWRHSYQVVLTRVSEQQLDIVQSDGRLISFHRASDDQPDRYEAAHRSDGYLRLGERSVWSLSDGRRLIFQGSFLVRMELGERAGALKLRYRQGKLHTVTDQHGDRLTFHYVPGRAALPDYGSEQSVQPAGALASVSLPGGDSIHYKYGGHGNLIAVQYPEGDATGYVYGNSDWPAHLTRRQSTVDGRLSEWRYDDQGRGIAWTEGGGSNGLTIQRQSSPDETLDSPVGEENAAEPAGATVTYADGRQTQYRWTPAERSPHGRNDTTNFSCDNCLPGLPGDLFSEGGDGSSESEADVVPVSQRDPVPSTEKLHPALSSMAESVASMLTGLTRSENQPDPGTGRTNYSGIYPHPSGDVAIELSIDRLGKIKGLTIGETTLAEIIEGAYSGQLPPCFAGDSPENPDTFPHDRIAAMGHGESLCKLDPIVIVEFKYSVETALEAEGDYRRMKSSGETEGKSSVPFWDERRRYCGMPPGKTCDDLEDDLAMANLSRCAYGVVSCEPAFRRVPPEEINLDEALFHNEGFDAELYYDYERDRYVLAFRGTDGEGDDWSNNFDQAEGRLVRQYSLAMQLSQLVTRQLGSENVEFTGHSLGGGLASLAAIQNQSQATVFNTAALQPRVARMIGRETEYREADYYINHVHTRFDMVTIIQQLADDLGYRDMQTAPGISTEIPNPDVSWMNAAHANAETFVSGLIPVLWHSIDAVVHVLESLIDMNCLT